MISSPGNSLTSDPSLLKSWISLNSMNVGLITCTTLSFNGINLRRDLTTSETAIEALLAKV